MTEDKPDYERMQRDLDWLRGLRDEWRKYRPLVEGYLWAVALMIGTAALAISIDRWLGGR